MVQLLMYALQNGLTGTLELWAAEQSRAGILLLSGQPAKVYTSEPVSYLGDTLLGLGYLSQPQLDKALLDLAAAKAAGPATLFGQRLLADRIVSDIQLQAGLKAQVASKLDFVASFPPSTTYAYYNLYDGLRGWGPELQEGFDPVPMLWGILCNNPPKAQIDAALASVAAFPLRLGRGANLGRLRLSERLLNALRVLNEQPMRASEWIGRSGVGETEGRLLAYLLLMTRQVDAIRASGSTSAAARPSPFPPAPATTPQPAAATVTAAGAAAPTPRQPAAAPAPAPAPPARSATPPTGRPAAATPVIPKAAPSTPSVGAPLSPELVKRRDEITSRAATIDKSDYFTMLDIAREASRDQIEAAFFTLAKKWHPDRLPGELASVRDACSRVFSRMSEAHATLVDPERRGKYERLLADGSGSPETQAKVAKVVDAATAFQKAEVCLKRGDYVQAESLCKIAFEGDPTQPDYLAMTAWLLAMKPENQSNEKTGESIEMLTRAIKMNARCERAYFWRGMLLKRVGKSEVAMRDFREAIELDPRNIDAAREVRLFTMRGGRFSTRAPPRGDSSRPGKKNSSVPAKAGEEKGLLERLFKK